MSKMWVGIRVFKVKCAYLNGCSKGNDTESDVTAGRGRNRAKRMGCGWRGDLSKDADTRSNGCDQHIW